jgi:hypothetical protein
MNNMDVLPSVCPGNVSSRLLIEIPLGRRFATFKVFYTDQTPLDYEPPNFQAGDFDKDKWYFMTHDLDEVPDRCSIGKIETGHHSYDFQRYPNS